MARQAARYHSCRKLPEKIGDALTPQQYKDIEELGILADKDDQVLCPRVPALLPALMHVVAIGRGTLPGRTIVHGQALAGILTGTLSCGAGRPVADIQQATVRQTDRVH